ncbi:MAG: YmfQ family protein [Oscillibacter sp.]|nr:YmfQ family protein [Oscillibacter sp.]
MYERYLRTLLSPLGVYDLSHTSRNSGELAALGSVLDEVSELVDWVERESVVVTAEDEGLRRRESLLPYFSGATKTAGRRAALKALMNISGDSLTPAAIDESLWGCGVEAQAIELGEGKLQVRFPHVGGIPENFERIRHIVLELIPCHLEVEFYFRYQTWQECEQQAWTWATVEAAGHTWESFQKAIPGAED